MSSTLEFGADNVRVCIFQVLEYDTPEALLSKEDSAFSKMVQSTGAANAQYLRSLVHEREHENRLAREANKELDGRRKWMASSRWNVVAQHAIGISLSSSQNDLQRLEIEDDENILKKTNDAVITLQEVLEGKFDNEIDKSLFHHPISRDGWWSALYRTVEGIGNP